MANEPDNLVLELLRGMRADMVTKADLAVVRSEINGLATKGELEGLATKPELQSALNSLRADLASDLIVTRKEPSEQIVGLRRAMVEYHSSVIGHGIIISELEARVRRMEEHLNLPAMDAH